MLPTFILKEKKKQKKMRKNLDCANQKKHKKLKKNFKSINKEILMILSSFHIFMNEKQMYFVQAFVA